MKTTALQRKKTTTAGKENRKNSQEIKSLKKIIDLQKRLL